MTKQESDMLNKQEILNLQFIPARHKMLELAAFLDRLDRADGADDFRVSGMRKSLSILLEKRPDRARAILEILSDHSTEIPISAVTQGATGAPNHF